MFELPTGDGQQVDVFKMPSEKASSSKISENSEDKNEVQNEMNNEIAARMGVSNLKTLKT